MECDGDYKSIMSEESNEIGIEMDYENPKNHFPEAERNNRVIK